MSAPPPAPPPAPPACPLVFDSWTCWNATLPGNTQVFLAKSSAQKFSLESSVSSEIKVADVIFLQTAACPNFVSLGFSAARQAEKVKHFSIIIVLN